jgi:hypothetical protein
MSISQTVLSSIAYGNSYPPYDGLNPNFSSDKLKGNGYYGYTDGLHTVQYQTIGFVGTMIVQASLATDPTDADWFDIAETELNADVANSSTTAHSYSGNFVWCRISVRNFSAGTIQKVLYNT